jgi:hypothetical protein
MTMAQSALSCYVSTLGAWRADWAWGLPLIVLTVIIHVFGLGLINLRTVQLFTRTGNRHHPTTMFVRVMATMTLSATCLHALESGLWAVSYEFLGARSDFRSAMLYSMSAMTTFGHAGVFLDERWQLMGAIEALNGWLLFGLTTAFMFGMIQKIWALSGREA